MKKVQLRTFNVPWDPKFKESILLPFKMDRTELESMDINIMGKQISCLTQSIGCFVELMSQSGILSSH